MVRERCRWVCWLSVTLLLVSNGCGKTLVFNDAVEGTVRLDGKPLGNAFVLFVPDEPGVKAPGSSGLTDENGHYQLTGDDGQPGALVGKHLVVLQRGRETSRAAGEQPEAAEGGSGAKAKKDRRPIPPAYASATKTPLHIEVKADLHSYDLELSSRP